MHLVHQLYLNFIYHSALSIERRLLPPWRQHTGFSGFALLMPPPAASARGSRGGSGEGRSLS